MNVLLKVLTENLAEADESRSTKLTIQNEGKLMSLCVHLCVRV